MADLTYDSQKSAGAFVFDFGEPQATGSATGTGALAAESTLVGAGTRNFHDLGTGDTLSVSSEVTNTANNSKTGTGALATVSTLIAGGTRSFYADVNLSVSSGLTNTVGLNVSGSGVLVASSGINGFATWADISLSSTIWTRV